jgi:hypothetical protein
MAAVPGAPAAAAAVAGAAVAPPPPPAPGPAVLAEPDPMLDAVRLTAGMGGAMTMGSAIAASALTNAGKCPEVMGSFSVALLGAMLMFGGLLPMTDGDATNIVWGSVLTQVLLIALIVMTISRVMAIGRLCPGFTPSIGPQGSSVMCGDKSVLSAQCGSGVRRGMAKITTGISLLTLMYLMITLPGPDSTIGEFIQRAFLSLRAFGGHTWTVVRGDVINLRRAAVQLNSIRARLSALARAGREEFLGIAFFVLVALFVGLGIGLPVDGTKAIASACSQSTAC